MTITEEREGLPGCSELHMIIACPGYLQAKAAAPPETEENLAATFGQEVHGVASGELEEMAVGERASFVARECLKLIDKLTREVFFDEEGMYIWKESRFWLRNTENEKILSGRLDRAIANKAGTWLVTDNKSLPGFVPPAAANWQIMGLAACIADDDSVRGDYPVEKLFGAIIQPLVTRKPKLVRLIPYQIKIAAYQIRRSLDAAALPHAPRIPGPHCRYCPARGLCPAALAMPMVWSQSALHEIGDGKTLPAKQLAEYTVANLTPAQLEDLLPRLPLISALIDAVRDRAKAMAASGELQNFELKEFNGPLAITNFKAAREALDPFVTKEEFNGLLSIPVTALREIFVTRFAGINQTTKVAGGVKFSELIAPASVRGSATHRLVQKQNKQEETT